MSTSVELAAPSLLISVPQLGDTNFYHSVVLLLQHDESGSMGLICNRPGETDLATFCQGLGIKLVGRGKKKIFNGGPVGTDRAFIVHASTHDGPETELLFEDVRLSYSLETLEMIAQDPPPRLRIMMGYAGWGPGQLAHEMASGAWLVTQVSQELLFDCSPEKIWEQALQNEHISPLQLGISGANN